MTVRRLLGSVAAAGLLTAGALLGSAATAFAQETVTLAASGSGEEEVPPGSGEEGTSVTGSFQLTAAGALTYTVQITGNEEDITAGHIHRGAAGSNGEVVVPLDSAAINSGSSATTQIDPGLAQQIIDDPAGFYLNTHSASFPPPTGNARAQLTSSSAAPGTIDTGSGGQAAAAATGSPGPYVAGGALVLAAAGGGALLVQRRRSADAGA